MATKAETANTAELNAEEKLLESDTKSLDEMEANDGQEDENGGDESGDLAYTQRGLFTSEVFKIEVRNLPFFGVAELKKMLLKNFGLDVAKIKSPKRREFAYLCFRNQADQDKAIEELNGFLWKKHELKATAAAPPSPDHVPKRKFEWSEFEKSAKRRKTAADATCPLYSLSYEDQLQKKTIRVRKALKSVRGRIFKANPRAKSLLNNKIEFLGTKPSPKLDRYRNKSDFAVGKTADGEVVVGFRVGDFIDGCVEVDSIQDLPNLPENAKKAARAYQEFIRWSKYEAFQPETDLGHFRQLGVRTSESTDEVMLLCGIYSSNLTEDEIAELKSDLKQFFDTYDSNDFVCTSLYYQDVNHRKQLYMEESLDHLSGTTHIYDVIHGLKFRISPLAVFPVNTITAEVLYQQAMELAALKTHTIVLDLCSGIGTIGLCFAKHCKQVIGVESNPVAIQNAEYNAKENNIENCKFYCGFASDHIHTMAREAVDGAPDKSELDLIAIIDAPRDGLVDRAIEALREETDVKKFVYIAINPRRVERNWLALAQPASKMEGRPFFPTKVVAVDMFPNTEYTQLIVLFERFNDDDKTDELECSEVKSDEKSDADL